MSSAPILGRGSHGPDVVRLQTLLNGRGRSLVVDGSFGAATEAAVRWVQTDAKIRIDGVVGPATWATLERRAVEPLEEEDPKKDGLLIDGEVWPVPGVRVIGSHDAAWAHLSPGDAMPRRTIAQTMYRFPQAKVLANEEGAKPTDMIPVAHWIWHKTIADYPERLLSGAGPVGGARKTADYWAGDPVHGGAHIVVGDDGEVGCLADLRRVEAFHATISNPWSVGHETREKITQVGSTRYNDFWEAAANATLAITRVGMPALGIQLQVHSAPYTGHPLRRMLNGGPDMVGLFGHRDNTERRGKWDPGELMFEAAREFCEAFDFEKREDVEVWKGRQQELVRLGHRLKVTGIPLADTVDALKVEGYTHGIWALGRPNFRA